MDFFLPTCHTVPYIIYIYLLYYIYRYVLKRNTFSKSPLTYYISMVQISQWCVHRTNTMWCSCSYKIRKTSWPRSRLPLSTLDLFLASRVWVVQNWRSAINSISGETFWKWGCISIPSWEQDIPWQSHVWWISKQTCKASSEEFVYFPFPMFFWGVGHVSSCFMWFLYMLICWINRWSFPRAVRDGFRVRCMREVDTPVRSS